MKIPAYFTGFSSKTDGSAGLRFATQEISADQFGEFKRLLNSFGWLVFEEGENLPEVPKEKIVDGRKSKAQILRAVLWRLHEQNNGKPEDADAHYDRQMDIIIEDYKSKLD